MMELSFNHSLFRIQLSSANDSKQQNISNKAIYIYLLSNVFPDEAVIFVHYSKEAPHPTHKVDVKK
jgi:hypothetical protein